MAKDLIINFSTNWNNKLDSKCFTTFRMWNSKYHKGSFCKIHLKGEFHSNAKIIDTKSLYLNSVNDWVARIDTGYSLEEFKKIVHTMYKGKVKDVDKTMFQLILIQKV